MHRQPPASVDELCAAVAQACAAIPEVRAAYVFGSRVSGGARPDSDLDVAVDLGTTLQSVERGQVQLQLIAAITDRLGALGERTDVLDLRAAGATVAFRVLRDGRLVKETSRSERVQLEARIMRAYDDDAPRRALFLRAAKRVAAQMGEDAQRG